MGVVYTPDQILSNNNKLFSDAIKKAMLLYVLLYKETLIIKKVSVSVDRNIQYRWTKKDKTLCPIASMLPEGNKLDIPEDWNSQDIVKNILAFRSSKLHLHSEFNSLFAYVFSKSKTTETEKFMYLWMAMNGLYTSFTRRVDKVRKDLDDDYKAKNNEKLALSRFMRLYELGTNFLAAVDSEDIYRDAISVIKPLDCKSFNQSFVEDSNQKCFRETLYSILDFHNNYEDEDRFYFFTAYGYLLLGFPYQLRCDTFHANKPLLLFSCVSDDNELRLLTMANQILAEFLDKNLILWFTSDYLKINIDSTANKFATDEFEESKLPKPKKRDIETHRRLDAASFYSKEKGVN